MLCEREELVIPASGFSVLGNKMTMRLLLQVELHIQLLTGLTLGS